jgi:hypothetical protein
MIHLAGCRVVAKVMPGELRLNFTKIGREPSGRYQVRGLSHAR